MARTKKNRVAPVQFDGPTRERLSKGDTVTMIEPPESDRRNRNVVQKIHRIVPRRSIDALYQCQALTFWQWWAGDQYRGFMQDGWPEPCVASDYGSSRGGGSTNRIPFPLNDKAEKARAKLKTLRDQLSGPHRQCIEAAIIGEHQEGQGRARMATLDALRLALSAASLAMGGR